MLEVNQSASLTAVECAEWRTSSSLTQGVASEIALLAVSAASDNKVRPGDQIKVNSTSAGSGIRIYQNSTIIDSNTVGSTIAANSFSSPVVEEIDGSLLVDGTVSADVLTTDTIFSNSINLNEKLQIGHPNGLGSTNAICQINTVGKTNFAQNANGFFLGKKSGGTGFAFDVGDNTNYLRFDAENGTFEISQTTGDFVLRSGPTSGASLEINNDKIVIRDSSGTIRVQLGNLS
jgi:hypothetical protein